MIDSRRTCRSSSGQLEPRGTMSNPWLSIRLQDYEAHMGPDNAKQLSALSDLFKRALDICVPDSVAVLGIAGGNGLEHVNPAIIKRVVGFDINARYLDEVRRRFGTYPNLELHCVDLSEGEPNFAFHWWRWCMRHCFSSTRDWVVRCTTRFPWSRREAGCRSCYSCLSTSNST